MAYNNSRSSDVGYVRGHEYQVRDRPVNPARDVAANTMIYARIQEKIGGKKVTPGSVTAMMKNLLAEMGSE